MTEFGDRLQQALGDRYRIERELGDGAMGVVYLAEDLKLGRRVAIKVLRPELGEFMGGSRFEREIRISAQLAHPHILPLIDSGVADGLLYYVMRYVDGETLKARLERERQLGIDEAVRITREVADALDYAHAQGVIHRDIKPGNILLDDRGRALVCDFGIARALNEGDGERLTRTGMAVGTPAYMSPEQGTAEVDVDHRADIYALGCVLYEMLAGSPPFTGAPPHVLLARKSMQTAPGLRLVRETVPEHVESAVLRALARTPADRFATAAEFADALATPGAPGRRSSVRWWRAAVPFAAAAAIVAFLVLGAAALLSRGESAAAVRVRATQVTALPGLEDFPSISPDGRWVVYAGENGAHRDVYLRSLGGERSINLTEDSPGDDFAPAFSPDGERIAFRSSRAGGGLFVMGRTGEAVRKVSDSGYTPSWSPDGRSLAYVLEHVDVLPLNVEPAESGLWTLDLDTGEARELVADDAVLPSWAPRGGWIAYTNRLNGSSSIWAVPAQGGEPVRLTDAGGNDWGPAWSPDARFLYFTSDRGGSMNLWRVAVDLDEGRPAGDPVPVPTPSAFAAHPSVSGDGTRIVYTSVVTTQNVERAALDPDADTLRRPFTLTTGTRQWSSPDPSPDGARVTFYSRDLPEGDLYVARRDGTGLRQLTSDSAIDRVPRWSPDGRQIAYFSDRSGVMQAWVIDADGSGNRRLTDLDVVAVPYAWSPDGSRLVVNVMGQTPFLMDPSRPAGQQTVRWLEPDTGSLTLVVNDWSPDGARLAVMFGYGDLGVGYYDLADDRLVRLTDAGQWPVWLPDSRRLLFVSGGQGFYTVDSETGRVDTLHTAFRDVLGPPRLTADGRELFYTRRSTEGDIWQASLESGGP